MKHRLKTLTDFGRFDERMPKASNREKAILSLLAKNTVRDAAADCGLSEETLYRYLRDPEFKAEYRAARRECFEVTIGNIQKAGIEAVETLRTSLRSKNKSIAVRSAAIILAHSFKGAEIGDILERLEALENEYQSKT